METSSSADGSAATPSWPSRPKGRVVSFYSFKADGCAAAQLQRQALQGSNLVSTHQIDTNIEIEASAEVVWSVLSDFDSYPQWNPFIKSIAGVPGQGSKLRVSIQPPDGKEMHFSPVVLAAEPERELRWLGRLLLPRVFDGEHCLAIEPLDAGRVCFRQSERFNGLLVGLFRKRLDRGTKRGFEDMNRALKLRAEEKANAQARTARA